MCDAHGSKPGRLVTGMLPKISFHGIIPVEKLEEGEVVHIL
jgi:hypothetical protein